MPQDRFQAEIAHVERAIASSQLGEFAVPHLIVDNIFPDDLVARINQNWPEYNEGFFSEVVGNHILQMYRRNYGGIAQQRLGFWQAFNELFWPHLVSATAEAFTAPAYEVFGDLYYEHLSLDHPLTLMQADPSYPGHSMHQHFYHAPHWAFTMLLYIDPEDTCSRGTAIHRLLPRGKTGQRQTSYQTEDVEWRAEVAMETFHWEDPKKPDRVYREQVSDYKSNRLFVFLDGPLALHSVPFDNPDHTPAAERARDGGRYARRRILRSHVKVHHDPFYRKHSSLLPEPIEPESFMRLMAPNAVLSAVDQRYQEKVLRPFFAERLAAYARAAERAHQPKPQQWSRALWDRIVGRSRSSNEFRSQLVQRIP